MKIKFHYKALTAIALMAAIAFTGCEKDEGKLPDISFKTGPGYTGSDAFVDPGAQVKMGIEAEKTEDRDVLTTFEVKRTVNGTDSTLVLENLSGTDQDAMERDVTVTVDSMSGWKAIYTFTVVNRDGLTNEVDLTLTVK